MRRRLHLTAWATAALLAAWTSTALAAPPTPITNPASATSATTADFQAYIVLGGDVTAHFEYAEAGSPFCLTGFGPVSSTPEQAVGWVSAFKTHVSGLTGGQAYCIEVVASNPDAAGVRGGVVQFTAGSFEISMGPTRATSPTELSVVNGWVLSHDQATTVTVEYALKGTPFCDSEGATGQRSVSASVSLPASTDYQLFSLAITGLIARSTYCMRAKGVAASTAVALSEMWEHRDVGLPELVSSRLSGTAPTAQSVGANLRTAGEATHVHFEYAAISGDPDPFCDEPRGGTAQGSTPDVLLSSAPGEHPVDVGIDQLTTGVRYCYRIIATNATGTLDVAFGSLTAGAPAVITEPATQATVTNVMLHASVNAAGDPTTVTFEFAPASSAWCTSGGVEGTPGQSTGSAVPGDLASHAVALTVALAGGDYCFRAIATNARGTARGGFEAFHILQPPVNVGPPSITGSPVDGATLTIDEGTWTTESPITFYYDWVRCTPDACDYIPEAFDSSYRLTAADVGTLVYAIVYAVNDDGEAFAETQDVEIAPAPPGNVVAPSVSGDMLDGQRLTADVGTWTGTSLQLLLQWRRCDATGAACTDIDRERLGTYALTSDDVGHVVRLSVTGYGQGDSVTVASAPTAAVRPAPPSVIYEPEVHGTAYDGYMLTGWEGKWAGTQPRTFAWQWRRCDATTLTSCTDVPGATDPLYALTIADVGWRMRVVVTATNGAGSVSSTSGVSFPIGRLDRTPVPIVGGPAPARGAFDALTAARLQYDPRFRRVTFKVLTGVPRAKLVASLFYRRGGRRVLVGRLSTTAGARPSLAVSLNARGRTLFARTKAVRLTLVVSVTAPGASAIVREAIVTLKRSKPPGH